MAGRVTSAALETLRAGTAAARVTSAAVDVLRAASAGARVTSAAVEVLLTLDGGTARVTTAAIEVLRPDIAEELRVQQLSARVYSEAPTPEDVRVTMEGVEALAQDEARVEVTTEGVEALSQGEAVMDVTMTGVEVLHRSSGIFSGCVDRPVAYRVRIRTGDDTADALVCTSLEAGAMDGTDGWPVLLEAPQVDASRVDPLTGRTDLGACAVRVADPVLVDGALGCAAEGATRIVTALLADGSGRSQLIGRRVFVEASDDAGTTWGAYWAGYLTDVRFPDAITAELQMAHSARDDERRMVFSTVDGYAFDTVGCLAGGPVRRGVPVTNTAWRVQYDESPWTIECTGKAGDLVTFTMTNRFLPWDVALDRGTKKRPMVFLNEQIQKWFAFGAPTPALASTFSSDGRYGWFPRVEAVLPLKNGSLFGQTFHPVALPLANAVVGSFGTQKSLVVEDITGNNFTLYWPASYGNQPVVGDDFTMYLRPVDVSEANPGWIAERHPVDILAELWTRAGYAFNTASVDATKIAVGDYVVSLRITKDMTLADASAMLCGAFGFGWRMDPAGERVVFPTRAYGAPVQSVTVNDLASADGVVWATSESSKIGRVAYTFQSFYTWPAAQDGGETTKPSRALDGVVAVGMEPIVAEAPTALDYGVRTQQYEVPGYVFDPSGNPLDAFAFVDAQAVPILTAYQDGEITTEIDVLPSVTALEGDVVTLDLAHRPGFDTADSPVAQRGTPELAMVIAREPQPWGARLTLVRVGPAGDAISEAGDEPTTVALDPAVTVAPTTGSEATSITVTLTDDTDYAATGATVRIWTAVQAAEPQDNGTLWPTVLDPSIASTLDVGPFPAASTVWIRTQTVQNGVPVSGFTAWQAVTLDAQTGMGVGGGIQTPSILLEIDGSFNVSATVEGGPSAVKAYCVGNTTGFVSVGTLLTATPDTSVPFAFATVVATLASGSTAYVTAVTEDAAGNRSLRAGALYTRP